MKRRVLCIFILVFWALIVCTFLSIRIEELMIPIISTTETDDRASDPTIPADALFYDDTGMHLYRAFNGSGWEEGLRANEVPANQYYVDGDELQLDATGRYVWYATRDLRDGEVVVIQEAFQYGDDVWVAVYPEGIPDYTLTDEDMNTEAQTDTAMLISVKKASVPFMEDRARSFVETERDDFYYLQEPNNTFYSLTDLRQFMDSILLLGLLAAVLLFTVILWGCSFALSREAKENKRLLIQNAVIAAVLVLSIPLLLHFIDLPSSLLPQYHITDFSHYAAEFGELFSVLRAFAADGSSIAQEAIRHAQTRVVLAFVIAAAGIVVGVVFTLAEILHGKRKVKSKPRHASW